MDQRKVLNMCKQHSTDSTDILLGMKQHCYRARPRPHPLSFVRSQEANLVTDAVFFPAIVLAHAKLSARDIRDCLTSGSTRLPPDVLKQLLSFAPNESEVSKNVKAHQLDSDRLEKVPSLDCSN